ncbi:hypothetical protein STSP2_03005 [Anaerohalosphaera lusitana]|uniref:Dockerin domain-containing protein n=1 Tax=Anaerohalosphaera lusitana TaxID=1936003 RepID=A0A1U9NQ14_9BACT|nr:dockerin type I domain-containing protein [Anaerohalosphaera lusitana]AQT69808.1 hypothetical protein STSP2_03005 [Anaerohalosphaera lusitana]
MKRLLIVLMYLAFCTPCVLGDTDWTNDGVDRAWGNPANWNNGLPASTAKTAVRGNFADDGPVIYSGTDAFTKELVVGDWSSPSDSVEIKAGSLTVDSWFILAYGSNNEGTFNVNGGTTTCRQKLSVGRDGVGRINMTDGVITVAGTLGLATNGGTGRIQLDGGTITCGSLNITAGGYVDITAGTLVVDGNVSSAIGDYINASQITAYDGTGTVHYDYHMTNPYKTTVWAEPQQMGNGDVDGDGYVNETDMMLFLAQWLDPNPDPDADFTNDGNVDMNDFSILAKNWHHNEYSRTLTGKIMCGYQGWFNAPGDGANRGWVHWGTSNRFEPGYCTVDWWPDMSELDPDEKFATGFKYADGSTASVFSSFNEKTVLRHFSWMDEYGIDGVFLQRFVSETTPGSTARNHRDQVMLHCRKGANLHKRAWAMMYDLSSSLTGPQLKQKVIDDWKHLVDTYRLTQDPADSAYLHHNGKPVVAVWGLGFNRSYEGQDTYDIINFLKNDPVYGGCTVMIGVDNEWRYRKNTDAWFGQIVDLADIISPWAVGRYGSIYQGELNNFTSNYTVPDQSWCNTNGKDYLPVVFPGFSWQNLKGEKWDHIPRLGGRFLWRQYYKAINDAGATMIYQAMFDEVDEGTAIFKVTNNPPVEEQPYSVYSNPFLPTGNAQYAPYDFSDASLPSDHYLWLVGQGTRMLRGEIPLSETLPSR